MEVDEMTGTIAVAILTDVTVWLYVAIILVSFVGFLLFVWWWQKNDRATTVYKYVMLLFACEIISQAGHLHTRIVRYIDPDRAAAIINSWLWPARLVPLLIVYTAIVTMVLLRVMSNSKQGFSDKGEGNEKLT